MWLGLAIFSQRFGGNVRNISFNLIAIRPHPLQAFKAPHVVSPVGSASLSARASFPLLGAERSVE